MNLGQISYRLFIDDSRFNSALNRAHGQVNGLGSSLMGLKSILASVGGAFAVKGAVSAFLDAGKAAEGYKLQLRAVIGEQEKANRAYEEARQYAKATPFTTDDVVGAYRDLATLGSANPLEDLKKLGNAALVYSQQTGESVGYITQALFGMETEVFRRLGVEIDRTGSKWQLKINGQMVETESNIEGLRRAIIEGFGDKFGGIADAAQNTLGGQLAVLSSAWSDWLTKVSEKKGSFDQVKKELKDFTSEFDALMGGETGDKLADSLGSFASDAASAMGSAGKTLVEFASHWEETKSVLVEGAKGLAVVMGMQWTRGGVANLRALGVASMQSAAMQAAGAAEAAVATARQSLSLAQLAGQMEAAGTMSAVEAARMRDLAAAHVQAAAAARTQAASLQNTATNAGALRQASTGLWQSLKGLAGGVSIFVAAWGAWKIAEVVAEWWKWNDAISVAKGELASLSKEQLDNHIETLEQAIKDAANPSMWRKISDAIQVGDGDMRRKFIVDASTAQRDALKKYRDDLQQSEDLGKQIHDSEMSRMKAKTMTQSEIANLLSQQRQEARAYNLEQTKSRIADILDRQKKGLVSVAQAWRDVASMQVEATQKDKDGSLRLSDALIEQEKAKADLIKTFTGEQISGLWDGFEYGANGSMASLGGVISQMEVLRSAFDPVDSATGKLNENWKQITDSIRQAKDTLAGMQNSTMQSLENAMKSGNITDPKVMEEYQTKYVQLALEQQKRREGEISQMGLSAKGASALAKNEQSEFLKSKGIDQSIFDSIKKKVESAPPEIIRYTPERFPTLGRVADDLQGPQSQYQALESSASKLDTAGGKLDKAADKLLAIDPKTGAVNISIQSMTVKDRQEAEGIGRSMAKGLVYSPGN